MQGKKPKKAKSKRKPLTDDEFYKQFVDTACRNISERKDLGDMAVALLLTSLVENALMRLIDSRFVDLQCGICEGCKAGKRCGKNDDIFAEHNAPLGSLYNCSSLAHRMGLINSRFRKNLSLVGSIRNRFAHHPGVIDFDDDEVADNCAKLNPALRPIPKEMFADDHPFMVDHPEYGPCLDSAKPLSGRFRFSSIVGSMITELNGMAHSPSRPIPPARCGHAF
jgi:hypothetical protein